MKFARQLDAIRHRNPLRHPLATLNRRQFLAAAAAATATSAYGISSSVAITKAVEPIIGGSSTPSEPSLGSVYRLRAKLKQELGKPGAKEDLERAKQLGR